MLNKNKYKVVIELNDKLIHVDVFASNEYHAIKNVHSLIKVLIPDIEQVKNKLVIKDVNEYESKRK